MLSKKQIQDTFAKLGLLSEENRRRMLQFAETSEDVQPAEGQPTPGQTYADSNTRVLGTEENQDAKLEAGAG